MRASISRKQVLISANRHQVHAFQGRFNAVLLRARGQLLVKTILPGLLDVGFASLATFVVGFYAAKEYDPSTLGAYALVFAAFVLASNIPTQMIFIPCEVKTVSCERSRRVSALRGSLRLGLPVSFLSASSVALWLLFASESVPEQGIVIFTATAMACAFVSPVQDHVRRLLHLSDSSWLAAVVSAVQFAGVVGVTIAALSNGIIEYWIPFGALTIANIFSLLTGVLLVWRTTDRTSEIDRFRFSEVVWDGSWLLTTVLLSSGANFVAAGLVTQLAGAEELGFAEAARICAQPLWVLVMGLQAVLGPRSMEAAASGDEQRARRISRGFMLLSTLLGLPYLLLVGFDWDPNPLIGLLPNAYVVPHLVVLSMIANVVFGYQLPLRSELVAGERVRGLVSAEVWASTVRLGIAATARISQSYAMPLGLLATNLVRWHSYRGRARGIYGVSLGEG